jgi:hypothetical protein
LLLSGECKDNERQEQPARRAEKLHKKTLQVFRAGPFRFNPELGGERIRLGGIAAG